VEEIRKFFIFVLIYGTLGFKGNLAYTQKSTIGPKYRFLKEKSKKNCKNSVETPVNLSRTPAGIAWNVLRTL